MGVPTLARTTAWSGGVAPLVAQGAQQSSRRQRRERPELTSQEIIRTPCQFPHGLPETNGVSSIGMTGGFERFQRIALLAPG